MYEPFPLAYFITWTTYGSWLPGDDRGWVKKRSPKVEAADPERRVLAQAMMTQEAIVLTQAQREVVDKVIVDHCRIRGWTLHTRNVRTNHVHVVVSAAVDGEIVREQLKAWASRRLSEHAGLLGRKKNGQKRWFTEGGDIEWIEDDNHLDNAIRYVADMQ